MPLHYPGYNYCGPGTKDFSKKPRNRLDRSCRRHDKGYGPFSDYFFWGKADDQIYEDLEKYKDDDPRAAAIMRALFRIKKSINQVTLGQVTGSKRYGGTIDDFFRASKLRRPLKSNDHPTNNIRNSGIGDSERKRPEDEAGRMPRALGKRRTYRTRRRRYKRRNANRYKRRRNYKTTTNFNRKIAKILNPAITYENQKVCAVRATANATKGYSVLFDPQIYAGTLASVAGFTHGFHRLTTIAAAISLATGDTVNLDDHGKQYWVMNQMDKYRFTNMTSGVLFFRIHYMKCIAATNSLIGLIDNNAVEGDADLYPNTDITGGGGNISYGEPLGTPTLNRWLLPRTVGIDEIKTLKHAWKRVNTLSFKLQPNENRSVNLSRFDFVFDPANYIFGSTTFEYIPGTKKILVQVMSTITGSSTTAPLTEAGWDYMSYGPINVPFEYYSSARIAKRTTNQQKRYMFSYTNPAANVTPLTNTPAVIGEPVQTGGAAQNMAD